MTSAPEADRADHGHVALLEHYRLAGANRVRDQQAPGRFGGGWFRRGGLADGFVGRGDVAGGASAAGQRATPGFDALPRRMGALGPDHADAAAFERRHQALDVRLLARQAGEVQHYRAVVEERRRAFDLRVKRGDPGGKRRLGREHQGHEGPATQPDEGRGLDGCHRVRRYPGARRGSTPIGRATTKCCGYCWPRPQRMGAAKNTPPSIVGGEGGATQDVFSFRPLPLPQGGQFSPSACRIVTLMWVKLDQVAGRRPQCSSTTTGTWSEGCGWARSSRSGVGGNQALGKGRGQQRVVDAQAQVALPRAGLVVPERVDRAVRMHRAHRVGQAQPEQAAEAGTGFRADQRVGGR